MSKEPNSDTKDEPTAKMRVVPRADPGTKRMMLAAAKGAITIIESHGSVMM
jgi:hypothetical protein